MLSRSPVRKRTPSLLLAVLLACIAISTLPGCKKTTHDAASPSATTSNAHNPDAAPIDMIRTVKTDRQNDGDEDKTIGAAIDAELMEDGSVLVLYNGDCRGPESNLNVLVWYDESFNVKWQTGNVFRFPHTIDRKGKTILVSDTSKMRLAMLTLGSEKMKIIDVSNLCMAPNDADFTADGNILFCDNPTGTVFKIKTDGTLLWSRKVVKKPPSSATSDDPDYDELHDADELANGNLIYCLSYSNQVVEINEKDEIVWKYDKDLWWPKTVQRLENGNTLIGDKDKVIEVTRKGKIVWQYALPQGVGFNYNRYPDGNTLIGGPLVALIDPEGKTIWELPILVPSESDEEKRLREQMTAISYL